MKDGKCPKCGSHTVYTKQNGLQLGENQKGVMVFTSFMTSPTATVAYICTACGYFENYIADPKKLSEVAGKWTAVSG
jgi:predicted RNA-binding Zn-ribbon protein involved in translation (DUF1610 family)